MPPHFHCLDTQKVGNGTVADIATRAFANLLTAAGKKKNVCVVVSDLAAAYDTGAEALADEIEATYPFHPRLKNVIALFKEDVFLIGPQHFDLGVPDVRDKLTEISGMRDVIARDIWDVQQSPHAQIIDLQAG